MTVVVHNGHSASRPMSLPQLPLPVMRAASDLGANVTARRPALPPSTTARPASQPAIADDPATAAHNYFSSVLDQDRYGGSACRRIACLLCASQWRGHMATTLKGRRGARNLASLRFIPNRRHRTRFPVPPGRIALAPEFESDISSWPLPLALSYGTGDRDAPEPALASIHRLICGVGARRKERCPLNWDDGSDEASRSGFGRTPDKCDCRMIR